MKGLSLRNLFRKSRRAVIGVSVRETRPGVFKTRKVYA